MGQGNALGFMPGEWDWMDKPSTPSPAPVLMAQPKKRGGVMNALGSFVQNTLQAAAPEAYKAGQTDRMNSQISNALAGGDYGGAAQAAYGANDWQTGMQLGQMGQQAQDAQRQQEAQGVLNLFSAAQPAQISEMAMSDPVGFERMTGMTAEEYMQAGQRMAQAGLSPEQFHQYVIQKAQAELGMTSEPTEYGFTKVGDNLVRTDPRAGTAESVYAGTPKQTEEWVDIPTPPGQEGVWQQSSTTGAKKRIGGGGQTININGEDGGYERSIFDDEVDKKVAQEYIDWSAGGGSDSVKQLSQLQEVADRLNSGKEDLTGPLLGLVSPGTRALFNSGSVDAQQLVEEVVQRNLRLILGAQFTQKEGENLIARAYNPQLKEEVNAKRIGRLIQQISLAAQQKQAMFDYLERYRTLAPNAQDPRGFTGKTPSLGDFYAALEDREGGMNVPGWSDADEARLQELEAAAQSRGQ